MVRRSAEHVAQFKRIDEALDEASPFVVDEVTIPTR